MSKILLFLKIISKTFYLFADDHAEKITKNCITISHGIKTSIKVNATQNEVTALPSFSLIL